MQKVRIVDFLLTSKGLPELAPSCKYIIYFFFLLGGIKSTISPGSNSWTNKFLCFFLGGMKYIVYIALGQINSFLKKKYQFHTIMLSSLSNYGKQTFAVEVKICFFFLKLCGISKLSIND